MAELEISGGASAISGLFSFFTGLWTDSVEDECESDTVSEIVTVSFSVRGGVDQARS